MERRSPYRRGNRWFKNYSRREEADTRDHSALLPRQLRDFETVLHLRTVAGIILRQFLFRALVLGPFLGHRLDGRFACGCSENGRRNRLTRIGKEYSYPIGHGRRMTRELKIGRKNCREVRGLG